MIGHYAMAISQDIDSAYNAALPQYYYDPLISNEKTWHPLAQADIAVSSVLVP